MGQPLKNNYKILTLPVDYHRNFLNFTGEEIREYYRWFLEHKEERLNHLCKFLFVNTENWLTEENLNIVEIFLQSSVSVIPKTNEQFRGEIKNVPVHLRPYAKPAEYLFDEKTISVCYDIGVYLGELIIKIDSGIKWKLETDNEYSDYGQPILVKRKEKFSVNPFMVAKNTAAKIYENRYTEGQLIGFFNAWKKEFHVG